MYSVVPESFYSDFATNKEVILTAFIFYVILFSLLIIFITKMNQKDFTLSSTKRLYVTEENTTEEFIQEKMWEDQESKNLYKFGSLAIVGFLLIVTFQFYTMYNQPKKSEYLLDIQEVFNEEIHSFEVFYDFEDSRIEVFYINGNYYRLEQDVLTLLKDTKIVKAPDNFIKPFEKPRNLS